MTLMQVHYMVNFDFSFDVRYEPQDVLQTM